MISQFCNDVHVDAGSHDPVRLPLLDRPPAARAAQGAGGGPGYPAEPAYLPPFLYKNKACVCIACFVCVLPT